jgi:maltooligosyltrehalose trehalohydrolase
MTARRFPVGVEVLGEGRTHARVWTPRRRHVELVPERGDPVPLTSEPGGYFAGFVPGLAAGDLYRYRLDGETSLFPDPASRFQPEGPHGPSQVVDGRGFPWTDGDWGGAGRHGQVIYELHVGTFTPEGTYAAAAARLPALRDLGVTLIEMMPVADFCGRFGWGYDGVDLWAPTRLYGQPDDLRRFVDAAHRGGVGVILDVVYNHLGPDGNYLETFSPGYFTDRYENEWGKALNFDGSHAGPVREFFVENAGYWIDEFHFDGLRLDATQQIFDTSPEHVIAAIGRRVRQAAGKRATIIVAENEPQETRLVRPAEAGGYGLDALWNDDFHHSARVALTGRNEAYYSDHLGRPQELLSAIRWGYLYQGQRYRWQKQRRGTPALDLEADNFVLCLENHDQVANSGRGERLTLLTSPGELRAMTALLLLAPGTPMLFQGQEFGSTRPFLYFADHGPDLARLVAAGRREFLSQFPSLATAVSQAAIPDPSAEATFSACKLDWDESRSNAHLLALHRDLLAMRRQDAAFRQQRADRVHGAVLAPDAFVLRFFGDDGDRLLLVNLGADLELVPAPEPLLAPPAGGRWRPIWSSEDPRYGGSGVAPIEDEERGFRLPARSAAVLAPDGGESPSPSFLRSGRG